ncbi:MAG: hypothetical protein ACI4II_06095 [Acutalibacteraceae bacterium]
MKRSLKKIMSLLLVAVLVILTMQCYVFADVNSGAFGKLVIGSDEGLITVIVDNDGNIAQSSGFGFTYSQTNSKAVLKLDNLNHGKYLYADLGIPLEINVNGNNMFVQYSSANVVFDIKGDVTFTGNGTLELYNYYAIGYEKGDYSFKKIDESMRCSALHVYTENSSTVPCNIVFDGPTVKIQSVGEAIVAGNRYTEEDSGMITLKESYGKISFLSGSLDLYSSFGSPAITIYTENTDNAVYMVDALGAADNDKIGGAYVASNDVHSATYYGRTTDKIATHVYVDKKYRKYIAGVTILEGRRYVRKAETLTLRAKVDARNGADEGVTWSVKDSTSSKTRIDANGKLFVAEDETASYITVVAAASFDTGVYKTVKIKIDPKNTSKYDVQPYTGDAPITANLISSNVTVNYTLILGAGIAILCLIMCIAYILKRRKEEKN